MDYISIKRHSVNLMKTKVRIQHASTDCELNKKSNCAQTTGTSMKKKKNNTAFRWEGKNTRSTRCTTFMKNNNNCIQIAVFWLVVLTLYAINACRANILYTLSNNNKNVSLLYSWTMNKICLMLSKLYHTNQQTIILCENSPRART